jgi:hypothetical protein
MLTEKLLDLHTDKRVRIPANYAVASALSIGELDLPEYSGR